MMIRGVLSAILFAVAVPSSLASDSGFDGILRLSQVEGRAEVVDRSTLLIHGRRGIISVRLITPAGTALQLQKQLVTATNVRCLLLGNAQSATCTAEDSFGSRWSLGAH